MQDQTVYHVRPSGLSCKIKLSTSWEFKISPLDTKILINLANQKDGDSRYATTVVARV